MEDIGCSQPESGSAQKLELNKQEGLEASRSRRGTLIMLGGRPRWDLCSISLAARLQSLMKKLGLAGLCTRDREVQRKLTWLEVDAHCAAHSVLANSSRLVVLLDGDKG